MLYFLEEQDVRNTSINIFKAGNEFPTKVTMK